MEGGIFNTTTEGFAFARGMDIMNLESSKTFRWSIRLTGNGEVYIGIASKLERRDIWIDDYDTNSILFSPFGSKIYIGRSKSFISNISDYINNVKIGEEVHFRFEPKLQKFTISFVRPIIPM